MNTKTRAEQQAENPINNLNSPFYDDIPAYFANVLPGDDGDGKRSLNAMMQEYVISHGGSIHKQLFDNVAAKAGFITHPNGGDGYWNPKK